MFCHSAAQVLIMMEVLWKFYLYILMKCDYGTYTYIIADYSIHVFTSFLRFEYRYVLSLA